MASTVKPDAEGRLDFEKELREAGDLVSDGLLKFATLGLLLPGAVIGLPRSL